MKEAMFYEKIDGKVRCHLCNHHCVIKDGRRGICSVRQNHNGRLYSLVYGKSVAVGVDPIEKKPFFNFYPGTSSYSIATVGCNFHCLHCQNWEISQMPRGKGGKSLVINWGRKGLFQRQYSLAVKVLPKPTPNRLFFLNTLTIQQSLHTRKR